MRLPSSKRVCKEVTCSGGPWHGKKVLFPVQDAGDPLSLPFRVLGYNFRGEPQEFYGRYDLNSGKWVSLFTDPEHLKQELL